MTRQRLKVLASLSRRRSREAHGVFLVEGVRSVEAALDARAPLVEVLVAAGRAEETRIAALAHRAEAAGVAVERVASRDLERVGDARTSQGVIGVARRVVHDQIEPRPGLVVLDGVQDPGNVGTVIRTAAWFGVAGVVCGPGTADPESPKVVRAAMGGLWDVPLARTTDLAATLDALASDGLALWGADMDGTPVSAWQPGRGAALVLGSEAHGLSPASRERLSGTVAIPGAGAAGAESLNVSVAAGILLHAWLGR